MKKFLLLCSLFVLFCVPRYAKADITNVHVSGSSKMKVGEEQELIVKIDIPGVDKSQSFGLAAIVFKLNYDSEIFTVKKVEAKDFTTQIIQDEDSYYVLSQVKSTMSPENMCVGGLFCGNYEAKIKIVAHKPATVMFKISEIEASFTDPFTYETEDDILVKQYSSNNIVMGIKIHVTENKTSEIPSNAVSVIQSSNALLKSLTVENYDIKFDTYLLEYTLEVDETINSFSIKAETEDRKANYKIIGAEDLKANGNKVLIEVTAENGNKKTYIINVKRKENKIKKEEPIERVEEQKKEEAKVNPRFLLYLGILFGGIVFLAIVGFIVSKIRNRKLNKMLDEL
jgi:hypothetical protein